MNDMARYSMRKYEVENGSDPAVVAARLMCRPHIVFQPKIKLDGNMWCALYGPDLQTGISGFGSTPAEACRDFDNNWAKSLAPKRIV